MTDKIYVPQEFPRMIYHIEDGREKIVKSQEELDEHLSLGWTKDYKKLSEVERIKKQKEFHKHELDRLTAELDVLCPPVKKPEPKVAKK